MITKNYEVRLVDFDSAGVAHKSRYPLGMNTGLGWPKGVQGLALMEKQHDKEMFRRLFECWACVKICLAPVSVSGLSVQI